MIPWNIPKCQECQHHQGFKVQETEDVVGLCEAFPEGIPDEIYFEGADHTKAWPGDHGIRFKLKD